MHVDRVVLQTSNTDVCCLACMPLIQSDWRCGCTSCHFHLSKIFGNHKQSTHIAPSRAVGPKASATSWCVCRPEWCQRKLATRAQQPKPSKLRCMRDPHHHNTDKPEPEPRYITVTMPQREATPDPAGFSRASVTPARTQQATASPVEQSHRLPPRVQAKVKTALKVVLKPKQACTLPASRAGTPQARHRTAASAQRHSAALRLKSAKCQTPQASRIDPSSLTVGAVHKHACALEASAKAVLKGLDWADSQLTCSTSHATASAPARTSSTASSNPFERYRIAAVAAGRVSPGLMADADTEQPAYSVGPEHGRRSAVPAANAQQPTAHLTDQSGSHAGMHVVTSSPDQLSSGADADPTAVPCNTEECAGDPVTDSDATWSDSGHDEGEHASSPCAQLNQVCEVTAIIRTQQSLFLLHLVCPLCLEHQHMQAEGTVPVLDQVARHSDSSCATKAWSLQHSCWHCIARLTAMHNSKTLVHLVVRNA